MEKITKELNEGNFIRGKLFDKDKSTLGKYCGLVLGKKSIISLLHYELMTLLFGSLPGILGLVTRKYFYRTLFKKIGKNVIFGRNVTIRCPDNIEIGNNVVIDDNCYIDGRGASEGKLKIDDNVILARGCYVQSKVGPLHIGKYTNIGTGCNIVSHGGTYIGKWCGIAGGCEISGGLFRINEEVKDDSNPPFLRYTKGPVKIGNYCIVAYGATVVDGVQIGDRCMIGPGALVVKDMLDKTSVSAYPAIVLKSKSPKKE